MNICRLIRKADDKVLITVLDVKIKSENEIWHKLRWPSIKSLQDAHRSNSRMDVDNVNKTTCLELWIDNAEKLIDLIGF